MDGKQARRTSSSSALGMVVDHGCDAINAGVSSVAMGSVLGTGWTGKLFLCYFCSYIPFFMQTWEEYYSDAMVLPAFNGPNEGLLICAFTSFLAYVYGSDYIYKKMGDIPDFLVEYLPAEDSFLGMIGFPSKDNKGVTIFSALFFVVFLAVLLTTVLHVIRVYGSIKRQEATRDDPNRHNKTFVNAMINIIPFALFFPATYGYALLSPVAFKKYPILTATFYCVAHADLAIHIMVSHVMNRRLDSLRRLPTYFIVLLTLLVMKKDIVSEQVETFLLIFCTAFSVISLVTMIKQIIYTFAAALDIYVFTLGNRHLS